ncbi:MAG TPA: hypothetical protein ENK27_01215 [Desulfobulbus sp.]|nr:hypothetical protein [Desulfobulbus sp.]
MQHADTLYPLYAELLEKGEVDRYITSLCRDGINWWFDAQTLRIAVHLEPLASLGLEEESLPLRLLFLRHCVAEDPSAESFEQLYASFLLLDDLEGVYGCVGAAIAAIWTRGADFRPYALWLSRIDFLLKRIDHVSPRAVASLLGYKALAELTGQGNIHLASMPYLVQQHWAEKAESASLRLLQASTAAYCYFLAGDLSSAELLLEDTRPLLDLPGVSLVSRIQYWSCQGLCSCIKGRFDQGLELLQRAVAHPGLSRLPVAVWLHCYTNYLFGLSVSGDLDRVEEVSRRIMARTIPPCNYYNHGYLHCCLGIAQLRLGRARRALLHSQEARMRGEMCASPVIGKIAALLQGQALSDLGEDGPALKHLKVWVDRWAGVGFALFAAAGSLEIAAIYARNGLLDKARGYVDRARTLLPRGERPLALYRDRRFLERLEAQLVPDRVVCRDDRETGKAENRHVLIRTLGDFYLQIGDRKIYDRHWHGRQSKKLLKAIIVFGGCKVDMEHLAYLLWPDHEGDRAMNNLKMAISRLRQVGSDGDEVVPWIAVKHKKVSLLKKLCRVDAIDFHQALNDLAGSNDPVALQEALSLYTGDFLPQDEGGAWIIQHRDFLRTRFVKGVLELSSFCLRRQDYETALRFLEQARQSDPLHEGVYARLMEVYLAMGYRGKALDVFSHLRDLLVTELGVAPSSSLLALARQARQEN